MESDDVLEMCQLSTQRCNVWYNPFMCDTDSSVYAMVDKSRPCGPVVFIQQMCQKNASTM